MESLSENSIGILDGRYILMNNLGEGYSSQVYKVKDSLTNKIYAAKVFNEYEKAIEKEIEHNKIISQNINIEFPNFIKYITSSVGPFELKNGSQGSNTPKNKTYIIFELGTKGTLLYLIIFSIVSHINFGKLRYNLNMQF
jgi:serine/threonine protein kinase